jgi:hypothetical protein
MKAKHVVKANIVLPNPSISPIEVAMATTVELWLEGMPPVAKMIVQRNDRFL